MKKELSGKVLIVTGSTGTLGAEMADKLAQAGATIVLCGRNIRKLENIYDRISKHIGQKPAIYPIDFLGANTSDYDALFATVQQEKGHVDGIIHCAATLEHLTPLEQIAPDQWAQCIHVNLTVPFLMTQAIRPFLMRSRPAISVFIGDDAVGDGKAFWGAYGVAKRGLQTLANTLREEQDPTVFGVEFFTPGPMQSRIRLKAFPSENRDRLVPAEVVAETLKQKIVHMFNSNQNFG
jgi:NAD(P)-dependent dehydrogenase (short-subunit alcohol dehydrogenase family)